MTRMRLVALFGMSVFVVGFALCARQVRRAEELHLVGAPLWALAITICLFALTPIDMIVMNYNVNRILSGDPAPCDNRIEAD